MEILSITRHQGNGCYERYELGEDVQKIQDLNYESEHGQIFYHYRVHMNNGIYYDLINGVFTVQVKDEKNVSLDEA